jgi:hypothetical protein
MCNTSSSPFGEEEEGEVLLNSEQNVEECDATKV